jgi:hypothetical protein
VTVRGENYVSVIDPAQMKEIRRIELANGPGMTMFGPDGKYAFVCSSFTPELAVIDVASHKIVKRLPQVSPFSPNIAVTPENDEVWITLKDVGKVQVFNAKPPFEQKVLYRADYESRTCKQSQRQIRVCDSWFERSSAFAGRDTGVGCYDSGGVSFRTNLAVRLLLPSLCRKKTNTASLDTVTTKVNANIPIGQTTQVWSIMNAVPAVPARKI